MLVLLLQVFSSLLSTLTLVNLSQIISVFKITWYNCFYLRLRNTSTNFIYFPFISCQNFLMQNANETVGFKKQRFWLIIQLSFFSFFFYEAWKVINAQQTGWFLPVLVQWIVCKVRPFIWDRTSDIYSAFLKLQISVLKTLNFKMDVCQSVWNSKTDHEEVGWTTQSHAIAALL